MEATLGIGRRARGAALVLAVFVLLAAAMAAGYGIRALTAVSTTHTTAVASGGEASPAQPDAPCIWTGTAKGC